MCVCVCVCNYIYITNIYIYIYIYIHIYVYLVHTHTHTHTTRTHIYIYRGCPRGVMVKAMDFGIVVCEFKLQSAYYVHFRASTLGKGMNPLSSQLWVK